MHGLLELPVLHRMVPHRTTLMETSGFSVLVFSPSKVEQKCKFKTVADDFFIYLFYFVLRNVLTFACGM